MGNLLKKGLMAEQSLERGLRVVELVSSLPNGDRRSEVEYLDETDYSIMSNSR